MILWLGVDCTCARTTMLLATPTCHRTLLARSTGKATRGWATINAFQFLESEPWINILAVGVTLADPTVDSSPAYRTPPALSAADIVRSIAAGDLSSSEVVEAFIARILEVNAKLNAVTVKLFQSAREAAQKVDAARRRCEPLGALAGRSMLNGRVACAIRAFARRE
jgi:hypothetical protein